MYWLVSEIKRQAILTADRPGRFFRLLGEVLSDPRGRVRRYQSFLGINRKVGERWSADEAAGTRHRTYRNYDDYLEHQASKLQHIDLSDYDQWFRECLAERLKAIPDVQPGLSVLCLAARLGTEVKAFHDAGCFAVGIDLNPGPHNGCVLPGDFHDIQFPAASVDAVYTNSLDHAFNVSKMLREIRRVLKPAGFFMLEAPYGIDSGQEAGQYESFWWESDSKLEEMIVAGGFTSPARRIIERPFSGVNLIFRVSHGGTGDTENQ